MWTFLFKAAVPTFHPKTPEAAAPVGHRFKTPLYSNLLISSRIIIYVLCTTRQTYRPWTLLNQWLSLHIIEWKGSWLYHDRIQHRLVSLNGTYNLLCKNNESEIEKCLTLYSQENLSLLQFQFLSFTGILTLDDTKCHIGCHFKTTANLEPRWWRTQLNWIIHQRFVGTKSVSLLIWNYDFTNTESTNHADVTHWLG